MAQIWKVRMPDGTVVTPGEWTAAEPLYSTVEIGPGSFPVLVAFSYGRGGTVPGSVGPRQSTYIDTNLDGEGNRLPENEELICYFIGVEVFKVGPAASVAAFPDADTPGVPLPDMLRLQRDIVMRFNIAAVKNYTDSCISYWPPGTGNNYTISGGRSFVSGAAANGEVIANNGTPSVEARRELASPLYVAGGETFGVNFIPGPGQVNNLNLAPTSRMRMRVYLDGQRRRPVA
jgi:hypothetical protein